MNLLEIARAAPHPFRGELMMMVGAGEGPKFRSVSESGGVERYNFRGGTLTVEWNQNEIALIWNSGSCYVTVDKLPMDSEWFAVFLVDDNLGKVYHKDIMTAFWMGMQAAIEMMRQAK